MLLNSVQPLSAIVVIYGHNFSHTELFHIILPTRVRKITIFQTLFSCITGSLESHFSVERSISYALFRKISLFTNVEPFLNTLATHLRKMLPYTVCYYMLITQNSTQQLSFIYRQMNFQDSVAVPAISPSSPTLKTQQLHAIKQNHNFNHMELFGSKLPTRLRKMSVFPTSLHVYIFPYERLNSRALLNLRFRQTTHSTYDFPQIC